MKGKFLALAAVGAVAFAFSSASTPATAHHVLLEGQGNGLPHIQGKLEKLHLRAQDGCPSNPHDTNEGSNGGNTIIFNTNVQGGKGPNAGVLGENDIELLVNTDWPVFTVVDGNACDDDPAQFTLPSDALFDENSTSDLVADSGEWAVFVRMRGKPYTGFEATLCYTDSSVIVCDTGDSVDITRGKGKPRVEDVTNELLGFDDLSSFVDEDGEPTEVTQTWWEVDPNGNFKATLYFYHCDALPEGIGEGC